MNTTSLIEAFNSDLLDAKREALVAIRAIVQAAINPPHEDKRDPRILAQARMAAAQILHTPFLKPEKEPATKRDREGASSPPAPQPTPVAAPASAPAPAPTPAQQQRAEQIDRIAAQALRDLERYQDKIRQREERRVRNASDLTARAGAGSSA